MAGCDGLLDASLAFRVLHATGTCGRHSGTVARVHPCRILHPLMDTGTPILQVDSVEVLKLRMTAATFTPDTATVEIVVGASSAPVPLCV